MSHKIRLLKPDEFFKLKKAFRSLGSGLDPTKNILAAAVAESEDSQVIGVRAVAPIIHAGPIWVDERFRGNGIGTDLHNFLDNYLREQQLIGYYSNPTSPEAIHLCEKLGMIELPGKFFKREL